MLSHSVRVALIGYGNQGRAQALNLRDAGYNPLIGCRLDGPSADQARSDGWNVVPIAKAVSDVDFLLLLLPDEAIGPIHAELVSLLAERPRVIGLAHGYAMHFGTLVPEKNCRYVLVAPRGPGALLRERFVQGGKIPGVYFAQTDEDASLCRDYLEAIGANQPVLKTSFREETLCDLFGEQAVLCGGLMALMESSLELLVRKGLNPQLAFIETCYEVKTIIELFLKYGPSEMSERISPTAFFGGSLRGRQFKGVIAPLLEKIFLELENGEFAKHWADEVSSGRPWARKEKSRLSEALIQETYDALHGGIKI